MLNFKILLVSAEFLTYIGWCFEEHLFKLKLQSVKLKWDKIIGLNNL